MYFLYAFLLCFSCYSVLSLLSVVVQKVMRAYVRRKRSHIFISFGVSMLPSLFGWGDITFDIVSKLSFLSGVGQKVSHTLLLCLPLFHILFVHKSM
mmetsp:Transcript_7625/g.10390  ORF Transcript_7625/g.10390 Transcript_7625/m.10390 type:complete len:96 (-) Transcript_7625:719-1006(-)